MRLSAVAAIVLVALAAPDANAGAHLRSEVNSSLWYYWQQRSIDYYIEYTRGYGINVGPGALLSSDDIQLAAERAFLAWSSHDCTDIRFVYRGNVATRDSNLNSTDINGYNTIIFRVDDWVDTECRDAIACTTVVTKRAAGRILDADIDLNLQDYEFVLDPLEGSTAFDLQSVLTHEAGHMIGLDHTQAEHADAVMWPYADWGEDGTRRVLTTDDVDTMCEMYPAGQCPIINDRHDPYCGPPATGCFCGVAPEEEHGEGWTAALGALAVLSFIALRGRR